MSALLESLSSLPLAARIGLGALLVVQLGLQIYGLVDLARRDRVPGGRKWPWALVIVFGNLLGAIVYLAVGRSAAPAAEPVPRAGETAGSARRAIDSLYGGPPEP